MNLPQKGQYIDVHTHSGISSEEVYVVNNFMAHEELMPYYKPDEPCTCGIHPWNLEYDSFDFLVGRISVAAAHDNMIAIGEAGFDKLRGAPLELQRHAFSEQIIISEKVKKPVVIHCVRAWDELFMAYKQLKPKMPWLIHGFRGNKELASQLLSKGFYLSFWFDFILRPESAPLVRALPRERIFLETDGAEADIRNIYNKVAEDMEISVEELKAIIKTNFTELFSYQS